MTVHGRRFFLSGLVLGAAACVGCDLGSLAYFLVPENDAEAECRRLASNDPKKEVRVVILTYTHLETRAEFIGADRALSEMLGKHLRELSQQNKEKLTVVSSRKVEEYKNNHPSWKEADLAEVGRHFKADYVIYLEIGSLGMYQRGSSGSLYRGEANLSYTLVEVNNPDESPEQHQVSYVYPSDARAMDVSPELPPMQFRQMFLNHVAQKLSWCFASHPRKDKYLFD
jgi:hypothetical protein